MYLQFSHDIDLQENAEKEELVKRAIKDKRSVEAELERITKEGHVSSVKDKMAYEDLNRRAVQAERARDEAEVKIENIASQLKREAMKWVNMWQRFITEQVSFSGQMGVGRSGGKNLRTLLVSWKERKWSK